MPPIVPFCSPIFQSTRASLLPKKAGPFQVTSCEDGIGGTHGLDVGLAAALAQFWKMQELASGRAQTVLELGAGCGCYTNLWRRGFGIRVTSFDGSARIGEITRGLVAGSFDLSQAPSTRQAAVLPISDWVVSFEVGEHILSTFEQHYYRNLVEHARVGLILSWARRGQARTPAQKAMHPNEKDSEEIIVALARFGFTFDRALTRSLRLRAGRDCCEWFKASLLVFLRTTGAEPPPRITRFSKKSDRRAIYGRLPTANMTLP